MLAAIVLAFQFKPVQTYFAKKAAAYLSDELHTTIEIKSLFIKPFTSVVLEGLYVQDQQKDTLLYTPEFTVNLNYLSIKHRIISVNKVELDNGKFFLKDLKDRSTNLDFIINYFNTGKPNVKKKPSKPYDISFDEIVLNNVSFRYKNFRVDTAINGINFDDVNLTNLGVTLFNLDTRHHLMKARIKQLTFREKSGFYLKNLSALATIDSNKMEFENLMLQTPQSVLRDYVSLSYKNFNDFNHFIRKVKVKAHLEHAVLNPRDIAFFAPEVSPIKLSVQVDGNVSGYVNNIKAKGFSVKAGQATYLKGDFDIKGLPKLNETFLDLSFDQIYSNKKDAEKIISDLTGSKHQQVPEIISKFGNINFKGRFTGFPTDFIAFGEFKTRLGRIVSDVNMKIKKVPEYSGRVKVFDFNIGELVNEPDLKRMTGSASINGQSFEKKYLKENLNGTVAYLDFKGYRYQNIKVDGTFNKNLFDGQINVNDKNVRLNFNGNINLNPELPQFNFVASIRQARLNRLNFTKDTLRVDADFRTNFTGNSLDNIQGILELKTIKLTKLKDSLTVDSVSLFAEGLGSNRSLSVRSDILDASINGQYDLNTLPSYFKSIVKKYIPSLQTTIVNPAPQNFDFSLNLKHFDPITLLFIPDLKLPDGATISGKFVSAQNIATLNAFAKQAIYRGVKVNNLILDETTGADALNVFITSDRVDLTDSLYIKNVNIANILQNDSLNLNVKLSDKDATNQLDLNGLVRFQKDSSALFSILPSDVIINNQTWKVEEQVKIGFDKGKISINNFELSNDNQVATVNGVISDSPEDELDIKFDKFKLTTFNPLTKAAGITLKGELNGGIALSAITKAPRVESVLAIDSLNMNDTDVGNLNLKAGFDNETHLVNVDINILRQDLKTLNLTGTYNTASGQENTLDMNVRMDNSQIVIFQPFLSNLVSNLTGTVSADLRLTGTLLKPYINGNLSLNNAGLVVNYLQTPYHISDQVEVENSVIKLNNLVLRDPKNHEAIANGTVNMNNPNNPDIHVTVVAHNFMALNTKAKDNADYYGTAYGTGTFRFNGPTDNMEINIDAKTEAGTIFNIPLNSAETVGDNDFITFVSKDSVVAPKRENIFKGLVMNLDLVVDENSEVNIFTDLGKLSGRGQTESLNLKINSDGDFTMLGTYNISKGKFEFTAKDFINKVFQIDKGGSIRWTGDPTDAVIDLKAVYEVRASLQPLYIAAGRPTTEDRRVLAQAVMNLNGNLMRPDISFDLNFPNDSYVKDELQGFFSDASNKNQQALSLIVRRSFSPNTGLNLGTVNQTLTSTGTELLFNQFNNILAQSLNLNFVDFNIRSFNEASASLRLLNDRLAFTYGITDRGRELNNYNENSVARDVEALYLLRKDGSLVLRASNRLNNRSFLDPSSNEYVSAIGLVYQQEFDNFGEFLKILIGQKRREERRNEKSTPNKPIALKPDEDENVGK